MMEMIMNIPVRLLAVHASGSAYVDRTLQDLRNLTGHEADAITGHWSELAERLAVARRARDVVELVRDQIDLLPETRARLRRDHYRRRTLLRGLVVHISDLPRLAA
jgi:hypothetical protein